MVKFLSVHMTLSYLLWFELCQILFTVRGWGLGDKTIFYSIHDTHNILYFTRLQTTPETILLHADSVKKEFASDERYLHDQIYHVGKIQALMVEPAIASFATLLQRSNTCAVVFEAPSTFITHTHTHHCLLHHQPLNCCWQILFHHTIIQWRWRGSWRLRCAVFELFLVPSCRFIHWRARRTKYM